MRGCGTKPNPKKIIFFFFKWVFHKRENKPESPEEEARIEKFLELLTLPKWENLVDESGFLRRRRREEEECEAANGGASIVVAAAAASL